MALITNLITAALSKILGEEISAWSPRAVGALLKTAVKLLPEKQRERFAEEWQSHLNEVPGTIGKMFTAAGFLVASCRIRLTDSREDDLSLDWLDAPSRFRDAYIRSFHTIEPIANDERLVSDENLNSIVEKINACISEWRDVHDQAHKKLLRWAGAAEKRKRKLRPKHKVISDVVDQLAYSRMRKYVKPRFDLISRNAEQIAQLTDQLAVAADKKKQA
jgi:hypothetical protein